jgi:nucleoid DNA-binding protein
VATAKKNLTDRIDESTGEQKSLVKKVVQQFFDEITAELAEGNRLEFRGFGVLRPGRHSREWHRTPRPWKRCKCRPGEGSCLERDER